MAKPKPVRYKKVSARAVVQQLDGQEKPYDVYRFSGRRKRFERPTAPGQTYRHLT